MSSDYRGNLANANSYPGPVSIIGAVSALAGAAIQLQTSAPHNMQTGDEADIVNVAGTVEANVQTQITMVDATHFTIGVPFVHAYSSGGTVTPIAFANAYASASDGDPDDAAHRNAASTYPSADRETLLLAATGAYKLTQFYGDTFAHSALDSTWWTYTEAGSTLNTWSVITTLGSFAGGAAQVWPQLGTLRVQNADLVEWELDTSLIYVPQSGTGKLAVAFYAEQFDPAGSGSPAIVVGSEKILQQTSGSQLEQPIHLSGLFQCGPTGSLFNLALAINQSAPNGTTVSFIGDYNFKAKIWRRNGVPQ